MPRITQHTAADIPERKRTVNADIFVSEQAIQDMLDHAEKGSSENAEVMGLLAGHVYRDAGGQYAVVEKAVTSRLLSDDVSVRFDPSDMATLFDALDSLDFSYVIVGWYHSHLGIGCFMSETDVNTHTSAFGEFGFAVVIDAIKEEMKVFKGSKDGPSEASMVVMEDHTQMA
jgi:proteasome lid subunit RPN8/RPN11